MPIITRGIVSLQNCNQNSLIVSWIIMHFHPIVGLWFIGALVGVETF
jgi:hypothetical protein